MGFRSEIRAEHVNSHYSFYKASPRGKRRLDGTES